ncbi:hypothetical protein [Mycobacterium sp. M26]|uniref:hypothetical protein n=1 Tax=Mycobacterium sp. M26 TaxID=1762962 RepID=UPI00073EF129|nr:hypothetical protein [Mycobacterium sp. M26]
MTTWSAPATLDRSCSRRQAKRLSQQFAEVGVTISPDRLRQISMGSPTSEAELIDVSFALSASQLLSEKRQSKRGRKQRRWTHSLIVLGAIVVALNLLLCLGLVMFVLTQHTSPY